MQPHLQISAHSFWTPACQALRQPIAAMEPTHLVLNSGLWGSSNAFGVSTVEPLNISDGLPERDGGRQ